MPDSNKRKDKKNRRKINVGDPKRQRTLGEMKKEI